MSAPWFDAPAPLLPEVLDLNGRWMGCKPAVICDDKTLSWREFHRQLCQVANGLRDDGLQTGDRVAVLMDNSPDMLVILFGIIVAGGVTVPLNPLVADPGLANMIRDAGAIAVFASEAQAPRLEPQRAEPGNVRHWYATGGGEAGWTSYDDWRATQSGGAPAVPLRDEDECNIIYSSGTTGQPKGIVHTHRRRLDWFYDLAIALRYDRASVNLCSIGLFSNISWAGMGCTLLTGGTVVIMRSFDAEDWLATVEARGVTHSAMVPVQFQRILSSPSFAETDLGTIKSLMCCGSPLGTDLKQAIMARLSPQLVELYGLTEGLITTLEPEDAVDRLSSVGKPLMGIDLLILDENDQPCAAGEAGEIVGRGRHLMAGYHEREAANRDATWTDGSGRRWLRTGDIGRLDEAGFLFLVDRKKDMIISGGMNLYPADIEATLADHPEVEEAAVIAVDSERWGESPLAVVVGDADPDALVAWTNERVGRHQRIVGAVVVNELPRNANGKILKRQLRDQYRDWLSNH
ncbi:MAG: AMP-binding protein [Xanthomonadales bacterium]|jgi:acyl-CoA synthetase (AMP-forming)/AMP-acid ligase II|nr:AMP-binding protein [Xanthomonadales bacterium]